MDGSEFVVRSELSTHFHCIHLLISLNFSITHLPWFFFFVFRSIFLSVILAIQSLWMIIVFVSHCYWFGISVFLVFHFFIWELHRCLVCVATQYSFLSCTRVLTYLFCLTVQFFLPHLICNSVLPNLLVYIMSRTVMCRLVYL